MTVSTNSSRISYTGNGVTTVFSFPYKFIETNDLVVYVNDVLQTSGYTVGTPSDTGANVTFSVAPAAAASIVIVNDPDLLQATALPGTGPFPSTSVERMADKLTLITQRLRDLVNRSFTLSDSVVGVSATLPAPGANQLIGWNSTANGLQNVDPASILTIAGSSGFTTQTFNGTGAQTAFTLSANPGTVSNLEVFISGVRQTPTTDYTFSGTTLTFVVAPPTGTANILVRWGTTLGIGVPDDGSVTTAKIVAGAVTTDKIASGAVTTNEIANGTIQLADINSAVYGTSGANKLLQLDGTGKLPALDGSQLTNVSARQIQPISASVGSNALTISASALTLDFRSTTLGSGAVTTITGTPANLVISSGSTLGTVNGVQSRIAVLAINNAGTIELAAVNIAGGNQLDETNLISTTAEGGAGAADSANVIYSTTARTNVAYRVIGYIESTQATAGTWATAPSTIQGQGGQALAALSSLGYGQTWQAFGVGGTRVSGTTYYNTTGKPITVIIANASAGGVIGMTITPVVGGVTLPYSAANATFSTAWVCFVVPAGQSYSAAIVGAGTQSWLELR